MKNKLIELKESCERTEVAYKWQGAPGSPSFITTATKPENKDAKYAEVVPGLKGEILLSGYKNTPTIVILKCKDVREFFRVEKEKEEEKIVKAFMERKEK